MVRAEWNWLEAEDEMQIKFVHDDHQFDLRIPRVHIDELSGAAAERRADAQTIADLRATVLRVEGLLVLANSEASRGKPYEYMAGEKLHRELQKLFKGGL